MTVMQLGTNLRASQCGPLARLAQVNRRPGRASSCLARVLMARIVRPGQIQRCSAFTGGSAPPDHQRRAELQLNLRRARRCHGWVIT